MCQKKSDNAKYGRADQQNIRGNHPKRRRNLDVKDRLGLRLITTKDKQN